MKTCHTCGHALWIGPRDHVPSGIQIDYPLDINWEKQPNTEPYCQKCWSDEEVLLSQMISKHRALGPKEKKTVKKKTVKKKKVVVEVTKKPAVVVVEKKKPVVKRSKFLYKGVLQHHPAC